MKKLLFMALAAILMTSPVMADGHHKSKPKAGCKTSSKKKSCSSCKISKVLLWTVKLPVRVVTATGVGIYDLVLDQNLKGFKKGYNLI